jgi:hypothetical protein
MHFSGLGTTVVSMSILYYCSVLKRAFLSEEMRGGGCAVTSANVKRSHNQVAQVKGSNFEGKAEFLIRFGV